MRFEFDEKPEESKIKIILKKTAFCLDIFIFETFIPWLAGLQMILALFANYFFATVFSLTGARSLAEFMAVDLRATIAIGAVFVVLLHLLYHIIIKGLFRTSLLIEMNIELFAVFLFFIISDFILDFITHGNDAGGIMSMAKYMYLTAACIYAAILTSILVIKYLKHKK